MIVLGSYIVEPYFTTPADAIGNSIALLISLATLSSLSALIGSRYLATYAILILGLAIISISTKDTNNRFVKTLGEITYKFVATFGKSKVIFSALYILATYTFFSNNLPIFIWMVALWICLVFFDLVGKIISEISKWTHYFRQSLAAELGIAIGCENPFLYQVEVDYTKYKGQEVENGDIVAIETRINIGSVGTVITKKHLLNKCWLGVYLLKDEEGEALKIDLKDSKFITEPRSIFASENKTYLLNIATAFSLQEDRRKIEENSLYLNRDKFVGYVAKDSNINTISFTILNHPEMTDREIYEGALLKTTIYNDEALYQVINGNTREEHLEGFDSHGYTVGLARKLGKYDQSTHELDIRRWMPAIYSPLFFAFSGGISAERIKDIAKLSIGRLPETDLYIPINDINAIVTHNTAILGILGIGKSYLAYELIKKISATGTKIICIDITNEYAKKLPDHIDAKKIVADEIHAFDAINADYEYIHQETKGSNTIFNWDKSGNKTKYSDAIYKDLCQFLFGQDSIPATKAITDSKLVRIYNPDYHKVSKGEKVGYQSITIDLTQAEKTRLLAENVFKILMNLGVSENGKAKALIVFEEAHSLIPEWNSVANDSDKSATNGTARVVLQGRKYGLGCMVITQRTANVSKSILNQCNTVFALRIFDDTGKTFLENYIGRDYVDTLPTLEERRAIAIGRGLKLKQPVIIQLNNKEDVI